MQQVKPVRAGAREAKEKASPGRSDQSVKLRVADNIAAEGVSDVLRAWGMLRRAEVVRRSGTRRRHGDWASELDSLRSPYPSRWRLESPLRIEMFGSFRAAYGASFPFSH